MDSLNKQLLRMQDEKLDIVAKLEGQEGRDHFLKEEIVTL